MAQGAAIVSELQVEDVTFPGNVKPPGSTNSLFLGGAGVRIAPRHGQFTKVTAIGIYLGQDALYSLAPKWKGKTTDELSSSLDLFTDIVWVGEFEKFVRVTIIVKLTGEEYAEKVTENCVAYWKEMKNYTNARVKAVEEFKDAFKDETFPPGASIAFSKVKDGPLPKVGSVVIEKKQMGEVVLETIIGKHGVSPAARRSLAESIHGLLLEFDAANVNVVREDIVEVASQAGNGDSILINSGEVEKGGARATDQAFNLEELRVALKEENYQTAARNPTEFTFKLETPFAHLQPKIMISR